MHTWFIRYQKHPHPFLTGPMTSGAMQGVVNAAAAGQIGKVSKVIPTYMNAPAKHPKGNRHGVYKDPSQYSVDVRPGPIWSPKSGGGPRVTALAGVRGPGVYFLEFGGTYTDATHAMKKAV